MEYVKVEDRVRVAERDSGLFALQVLHGKDAEDPDNWHGVLLEWCETSLEPEAAIFRDAIRLACEATREQCAELCIAQVDKHAERARNHGWGERLMGHSDEASRIAAAIQGLEV